MFRKHRSGCGGGLGGGDREEPLQSAESGGDGGGGNEVGAGWGRGDWFCSLISCFIQLQEKEGEEASCISSCPDPSPLYPPQEALLAFVMWEHLSFWF